MLDMDLVLLFLRGTRQSSAGKKFRLAATNFQKISRRAGMNFQSLQYSMEFYR